MSFVEVSIYIDEGLILFKYKEKYYISKITFDPEELVFLINQITSERVPSTLATSKSKLKLNPYAPEWAP